jgi:hypothetical protein
MGENCRSLHSAPPDFLWSSVALTKCLRLSLRKGAFVALFGSAWQEIRGSGVEGPAVFTAYL